MATSRSTPRFGSARTIHGVLDETDYAAKHAYFCAKNRAGKTTTRSESVVAYLNNGRWVADCLCGAGMGAYPGWASRCFGCGAIYADVVFPQEWQAGEDVLMERPSQDREWPTTKTLVDLIAENETAGVPVPVDLLTIKEPAQ